MDRLLVVLVILFLSLTSTQAVSSNSNFEFKNQLVESLNDVQFLNNYNRINGNRFYHVDTFPFFHRKPKRTIEPEEVSNALFPDSKSYLKPYNCDVIFNGKDPASGERKKELEFEPFFSYTASNIKPYLSGKDMLVAEAKMIKFGGGYTYLSILFHWNAKNPHSAYGRLKAQGAIRCYLTDDKSVTLYNNKESAWQQNEDQTTHNMQALFLLHPRQIKLLQKHPIINLTVYWERGYEEYPIYPITFFMDQIKCLEE